MHEFNFGMFYTSVMFWQIPMNILQNYVAPLHDLFPSVFLREIHFLWNISNFRRLLFHIMKIMWDKVFNNGPSEIFGREPLADHITSIFLKAAFQNFYLAYSWMLWPIRGLVNVLRKDNVILKTSRWNESTKWNGIHFLALYLCCLSFI